MRTTCVAFAIAFPSLAGGAGPDVDRVKEQFRSDNYTVTWGSAAKYEQDAVLEIGNGSGHGGTLGWVRFRPVKDGVEVLSIQFDKGRQPYKSKWPPDRAPVVVNHARMKPDAYATLLADLAVVDSAKLEPVKRNFDNFSTSDFWTYTRLTSAEKTLIDLNWAGYEASSSEPEYAKPRAAVTLAREAIKNLDFKEHTLTEEERGWASAKFVRDWKKFKGSDSHWWVRERYIVTVGVVGDAAALSTLKEILGGDPKQRDVYHAINAVTRLTKKDVRDKPVEEMDIEKTRSKVLELLRDVK